MQYKSIKIGLFVLLALVQLYIPANMIWQQQKTITQGKAYRFETAPVDPNDPFRGKYITLRFTAEDYSPEDWDAIPSRGKINVLLGEDENGLAKVIGLQEFKPEAGVDYFKAEIDYKNKSRQIVSLHFPFDKYFYNTLYFVDNIISLRSRYITVINKNINQLVRVLLFTNINTFTQFFFGNQFFF